MIKIFRFLLSIIFLSGMIQADRYLKVQLRNSDSVALQVLSRYGLDLTESYRVSTDKINLIISDREFQILQQTGYPYQVLIEDVQDHYRNRDAGILNRWMEPADSLGVGLPLGSMGGYYTLSEIYQQLDSLHQLYPYIFGGAQIIGYTYENRPIYSYKISDFPESSDDTVEILFNSLIHAREPQGMANLMYFVRYLAKNYNSDSLVNYLVNHLEISIVPVVNPDGYIYNEVTNPSGYGMWRKNRWNDGLSTWGVDLNRNFGYQWGYDNLGSSSFKNQETYRGISAFSEPETQTIKNFCDYHNFRLALNYHTYSNLLILPWSYHDEPTPHDSLYRVIGEGMIVDNNFIMGGSSETIQYTVNGAADDWMYGETVSKNRILSMTMEVGTDRDGFWPARSRILPLAQYGLISTISLLKSALSYPKFISARILDDSVFYQPGDSLHLTFTVINAGMETASEVKFSCSAPLNGAPSSLLLDSRQKIILDSVIIVVPDSIKTGTFTLSFYLCLHGVVFDSVHFDLPIGPPEIIYQENFDHAESNWKWGAWGKYTGGANRSTYCLSDSPEGNYVSYDDRRTYSPYVIIPTTGETYLVFQTRYDMQRYYDWGCVFFEELYQGTSTNLHLSGMIRGNGNNWQSDSLFGWQGSQPEWKRVWFNLGTFRGQSGRFAFQLTADQSIQKDGWYIDDFYIVNYPPSFSSITETGQPKSSITIFPNPGRGTFRVYVGLDIPQKVKVFNILGQPMPAQFDLNGKNFGTLLTTDYPTGFYFLVIYYSEFSRVLKFLNIR